MLQILPHNNFANKHTQVEEREPTKIIIPGPAHTSSWTITGYIRKYLGPQALYLVSQISKNNQSFFFTNVRKIALVHSRI